MAQASHRVSEANEMMHFEYPNIQKDRKQDIRRTKDVDIFNRKYLRVAKIQPRVFAKRASGNAIPDERGREVKQKERRVDALALRADEGRDKLRKASGRSKYPLIRRYPNGETRQSEPLSSIRQSITYGGEPPELKHLSRARKRKKHRFSK